MKKVGVREYSVGCLWPANGLRNRTRQFRHGQQGQSLIELALVLPMFVLLLLGAVEFARVTYAWTQITNAARIGVQYGAQNHVTANDSAGMQREALAEAPHVSGLTATASHFCACSSGGTSTCQSTDCSGSRVIEYVQVNTAATVDPLIYFNGARSTFNLTGKAVMRVQQ